MNIINETRARYISNLDIFYNDFINNISGWSKIANSRKEILAHELTFDDPEANEIQVSFYRIACYSNLAIEEYIRNNYDSLGLSNFFKDVKEIVGTIDFFDLEKLNKCRIFIFDNAQDLIHYTHDMYLKLRNTTYSEPLFYEKALTWFNCATSIVQSIVNTVISALSSFIEENKKDDSIDVTKVREGKGWRINEIPSIIDNYVSKEGGD